MKYTILLNLSTLVKPVMLHCFSILNILSGRPPSHLKINTVVYQHLNQIMSKYSQVYL